jgi:hypothetical protein
MIRAAQHLEELGDPEAWNPYPEPPRGNPVPESSAADAWRAVVRRRAVLPGGDWAERILDRINRAIARELAQIEESIYGPTRSTGA